MGLGSSTKSFRAANLRLMLQQHRSQAMLGLFAALVLFTLAYALGLAPAAGRASGAPRLRGPLNTVWGESKPDELKLVIVSDLDQASAVESKKPSWRSIFKRGTLKHFRNRDGLIYSIECVFATLLMGIVC